jgi:hypothetical protein
VLSWDWIEGDTVILVILLFRHVNREVLVSGYRDKKGKDRKEVPRPDPDPYMSNTWVTSLERYPKL